VDLFILVVWVVDCGLAAAQIVLSPARAPVAVALFAGAGAGWYWRGRERP